MMRGFTLLASMLSASLLSMAAPASAVIINGSFEDIVNFAPNGDHTMSVVAPDSSTLPGWTVSDSLAWIGPKNPFGLSASDGDYFLDLTDYSGFTPHGGVAQLLTTTAGHLYNVTFDLGSSSNYGIASLDLTAGGTTQNFLSTVIGQNIWEAQTFSFVATGASTTLSFLGTGATDYIGLDNVAVTDAGVAAVPEPASWMMMIVGFAAAGTMMRRRKTALAFA